MKECVTKYHSHFSLDRLGWPEILKTLNVVWGMSSPQFHDTKQTYTANGNSYSILKFQNLFKNSDCVTDKFVPRRLSLLNCIRGRLIQKHRQSWNSEVVWPLTWRITWNGVDHDATGTSPVCWCKLETPSRAEDESQMATSTTAFHHACKHVVILVFLHSHYLEIENQVLIAYCRTGRCIYDLIREAVFEMSLKPTEESVIAIELGGHEMELNFARNALREGPWCNVDAEENLAFGVCLTVALESSLLTPFCVVYLLL